MHRGFTGPAQSLRLSLHLLNSTSPSKCATDKGEVHFTLPIFLLPQPIQQKALLLSLCSPCSRGRGCTGEQGRERSLWSWNSRHCCASKAPWHRPLNGEPFFPAVFPATGHSLVRAETCWTQILLNRSDMFWNANTNTVAKKGCPTGTGKISNLSHAIPLVLLKGLQRICFVQICRAIPEWLSQYTFPFVSLSAYNSA